MELNALIHIFWVSMLLSESFVRTMFYSQINIKHRNKQTYIHTHIQINGHKHIHT